MSLEREVIDKNELSVVLEWVRLAPWGGPEVVVVLNNIKNVNQEDLHFIKKVLEISENVVWLLKEVLKVTEKM